VRLALLPEGKATVTPRGIKFGPNLYQCEYAEKQAWRLKARNYGSWKVSVGFDSRCADVIYLRHDETSESLACYIDSNSPFKNCDWAEIDTYTNDRRVASAHATHRGVQALSDLESDVGDIVTRASEKTRAALVNGEQESSSSRLKNMMGNTKEEIGHMHRVEVIQIAGEESNMLPTDVASEASELSIDSDDTYVPIPEPTNIRDIRERMLRDGKSKG
jgi:hypothetical protein